MCNALSPEKAVIWTVLHDLAPEGLCREDFTYLTYQQWFTAVCRLRQKSLPVNLESIWAEVAENGHILKKLDLRSLKRLLKMPPPGRFCNNAGLFSQALVERRLDRGVHVERLIN